MTSKLFEKLARENRAALVVFVDLVSKKEHTVTLNEALTQARIEGMRVHRYGNAVYDMKSYHAVEEQIILAFSNHLYFPGGIRCDSQIL